MNLKIFISVCILFYSGLYGQQSQDNIMTLLVVNVEGNKITSSSIIRYTSGLSQDQQISGSDFPRA
ncbi:MAG: hypothetical protein KAK01_07190, partial [Candidatus Marinimicrobia bacterium]|nr:hypothetical protein [Candidatus Neomarinimicrobiota bacterium]